MWNSLTGGSARGWAATEAHRTFCCSSLPFFRPSLICRPLLPAQYCIPSWRTGGENSCWAVDKVTLYKFHSSHQIAILVSLVQSSSCLSSTSTSGSKRRKVDSQLKTPWSFVVWGTKCQMPLSCCENHSLMTEGFFFFLYPVWDAAHWQVHVTSFKLKLLEQLFVAGNVE